MSDPVEILYNLTSQSQLRDKVEENRSEKPVRYLPAPFSHNCF
jgi:hypothetical protein